jgi:hypothetical protein
MIVSGPQASHQFCTRWQCRPLGTAHFDLPMLEASYEHFPAAAVHLVYDLDIYRVQNVP